MVTKKVTDTKENKQKGRELTPAQQAAALMLGRGVGEVECAKEIGVNISTVWRWKQGEMFQEEVKKAIEERLGTLKGAREAIDQALVEAAQKPTGSQDRRLYYQIIGELVERRKNEVDFEPLIIQRAMPDVENMSDEELVAYEKKLLAEQSRRRPKGHLPKPSK